MFFRLKMIQVMSRKCRNAKGKEKMLDEIVAVVKKCGDIILFADDAERNVSSKEGRANFVTKYDVAVQACCTGYIQRRFP